MNSVQFEKFRKARRCPSTPELLSFGLAEPTLEGSREIMSHLAMCDFCGAEVQLLARHQQSVSSPYDPPEMPRHLRLLAESLLCK